ncbi:M23 family metallopeptidase [Erythrobacter sp. HL-111]|uniref:M23 family metallopeptidase n=1 Tax=Erythrobacter sp. HL-111 TaxID=1798193 RepID=UPI0006DA5CD6|nr:M23 family metallopeptidase [Erythrobacter sp. HL-111]KPP90624.1 MAG: Peptidase, M23/M37 family [Erythrobacteraceae bacterium HL-111]SDS74473.1 Murein DD-endopeptidase MepM and murein hydrolase activator NlpD, contain LysM domain [Erythrobacter sp. HL-111]
MNYARDIDGAAWGREGWPADADADAAADAARSREGGRDPAVPVLPDAGNLVSYLRRGKAAAPPSPQQKVRRQVVTRVRGFGDRYDEWKLSAGRWFDRLDLAPDLAENIGSRRWFRGLGTLIALGAAAFAFWPDFTTLEARAAMPQDPGIREEMRSRMILPLGLGGETGRRMAPGGRVIPLRDAPERPRIELVATLAPGDSFGSMLRRAGLAGGDVARVTGLIGEAMPLTELKPGTQIDIVLGRRPAPGAPRPLDALSFRARFDLELAIERAGEAGTGPLALRRNVIRVDDTPLRVRGPVGQSLYRSMRAAGVPASAVQEYLRALDNQIDLDRDVRASDEFDIILAYRRAATGERQAGQLLYAGIDRGGQPKTQLMRWGEDGQFYEASGVGEQRRGLVQPVPGPVSSRYGMRRHPILGYRRMHAGLDFRARHGTPIAAVTDGRVTSAGRAGGCGIAVRIDHGEGLSTRYCHMSRMAVSRGQRVERGQIIGYVGSTGLSTGPHLHYEMYRGGRSINPESVAFVSRAQLSGTELIDFRRRLIELKQVEVGAALADLEPLPSEIDEPEREIEKIDLARSMN